jgi:hypothetical protein
MVQLPHQQAPAEFQHFRWLLVLTAVQRRTAAMVQLPHQQAPAEFQHFRFLSGVALSCEQKEWSGFAQLRAEN